MRPLHFLPLAALLCLCSAKDAASKSSDESCMLQVPQSLQLQPHAATETAAATAEPNTELETLNLPQTPSTKEKKETKIEEVKYVRGDYHVLAHIKGGWELCRQAADHMRKSIEPDVALHCNTSDVSHALHEESPMLNGLTETSCFSHVRRNPFEMVVSGYLYDMAGSEMWMRKTFKQTMQGYRAGCDPLLVACGISESQTCQSDFKKTYVNQPFNTHWRSVSQVFECSRTGAVSSLLPDAEEDETFSAYLGRVDTDAGLIAQVLWHSDVAIAPMDWLNTQYLPDKACSESVCFSDLYIDCEAEWEQTLETWQTPASYHDDLLAGAVQSCPENALLAAPHSTRTATKAAGIEHDPEYELVERLRELDKIHLNGRLAEIEAALGCGLSEKYAPQ